jgi:predicted DNA-binding transcriptional regulator AlpA
VAKDTSVELCHQPERLWNADDVAEFLRVSLSWVYLHIKLGDLPYQRIGGLVRFFPPDIQAYARGEQPRAIPVLPLRRKVG